MNCEETGAEKQRVGAQVLGETQAKNEKAWSLKPRPEKNAKQRIDVKMEKSVEKWKTKNN